MAEQQADPAGDLPESPEREVNGSPQHAGDSNLLFGILAMQMDFISREELIAVTSVWVKDKSTPISQVLLQRGAIDNAVHDLLRGLLAKHLERHDNDAQKSLAALSSIGSLRDDLRSLHDEDVENSLSHVTASAEQPSSVETQDAPSSTTADRRYRVLRPHARGGLGEVFVARDEDLHREVALKEIQRAHADEPTSRERFVREAEITGRLEHPGVVPVYGLGTYADGRPYYVMRFIQGDSLKEAIHRFHAARKGRQPSWSGAGAAAVRLAHGGRGLQNDVEFRQLLGRFVDVCDAIEYAHSRGVLHRDLKPGNIMLGRYGETLVVDWGLAKALGKRATEGGEDEVTLRPESGSGSAPTLLGQAVGTPQYMSPEQAAGRTDELGAAADVYSLGATLYSLLTGTAPFPDPREVGTGEVLRLVQRGEFPPPRALDPSIPRPLEAICLKAMSLRPAARYSTPRALADDTERWLADAAVTAYGGVMYRARMWARRHRTAVVAASLILAMVVGALGYYRYRTEKLNSAVAQHVRQVKLLAGSGAIDRAQAELAAAQVLASDTLARTQWRARVADWQQKLGKFDQFLKQSHAARHYPPPGIQTFGDVRATKGADEFADRCRRALEVYRVLQDQRWETSLDAGLFSAEQIERVRGEVGELLVYLALRTAIDFEDNEEGRGRTRQALELLRRAEQHLEAGPGLYTLRMLWHRRLGEDKEADKAGVRATELAKQQGANSQAVDQYVLAQTVQEVLKKPRDAIPIYERLLKQRPDHYRSHQGLWYCYHKLGDLDGQRRHLEVCIALDPNNATLHFFRGMLYFETGDYRQAFEDFDASVRKDDRVAIGYFYRGRMQVVFEDWAAAERDFSAAIARDPAFDSAFSWRAIANAKLQRHEQAASDAEKALSLDPESDLTHYYAARALAQAVLAVPPVKDGAASAAERYARRAVEVLGRGIELGFDEFTRLVPGGDFTPLYERADFRALVDKAVAEKIPAREQQLRDKAEDGETRLALAELYLAQVEIRTAKSPPEEADLRAVDRSLELFTQLLKDDKQRRSAARMISRVVQRKGELLDRLRRNAEADAAWERVALLDGPERRQAVLIDRAHHLARWNEHARAAELLQPLNDAAELAAGHCYNAACVLAIAAAKAQADQQLPENERSSQADQYARQAMRYLERARDAGYFQTPAVRQHMQQDADLNFLRDRGDLQALLPPRS